MKYKNLIKPAISLALLVVVLNLVNFSKLKTTFLSVPYYVIVTVVLGYAVGQILSSIKWWIIARSGNIESSYTNALRSYFIGMFANCFGLGTLGGDLTRAIFLANGRAVKTAALASVIADRAQGLAVLAFLGTLATAIWGNQSLNPNWVYILVIMGSSIVLAWLFGPRILLFCIHKDTPLRKKAEQVSAVFPKDPRVIIYITLISVLFHLLQISLHWIMGFGFGLSLPWPFLLVTVPFVNIFASLPISWNGLGVRESGYIFFFAGANILTKEQAIAFGSIWLLAVVLNSSVGGIISFWTKDIRIIDSNSQP